MSGKRGMTLRARWLGQRLRQLREASGLTLREAAVRIQREGPTLSRFETGLYPIRVPDVSALLDLYGVADPRQREGTMRVAAEVWQTGWWDGYAGDLPKAILDYAWIESRARRIASFDVTVVPGLLQTRSYMEALIRGSDTDASLTPFGARFRLDRQRVLTSREPPHVEAVLDESLLHRAPGGPAVLKEQLTHLAELAKLPTVDVRVLPFASPVHPSPEGTFTIFQLPEPYPEVGYVDTPAGGVYVETGQVERLTVKFDRVREHRLGPEESAGRIQAAMKAIP